MPTEKYPCSVSNKTKDWDKVKESPMEMVTDKQLAKVEDRIDSIENTLTLIDARLTQLHVMILEGNEEVGETLKASDENLARAKKSMEEINMKIDHLKIIIGNQNRGY